MNATKYAVLAQAFDAKTGNPLASARVEEINTATNRLFATCKTIQQVRVAYEAFWNGLSNEPVELVFVQSVTPVS